MTRRPIDEGAQAKADIETALDCYCGDGGRAVAIGFLDALEAAYAEISEHPAAGTPRCGELSKIADLRSRNLNHYLYLILYIDGEDHVDVWRVLHGQRDIPTRMQER